MGEIETKVFPIERLREFTTRVFLHYGVPQADADQASDVLAAADLRGIDSHGVARLWSYTDLLGEGLINGCFTIRIGIAAVEILRPLPYIEARQPGLREFAAEFLKFGQRQQEVR